MRRTTILAAILLSGCAYDPPVIADHQAAAYKTDLEGCQTEAAVAARKLATATFKRFVVYPFSYPSLKREQTRLCMQKKGYASQG